MGFGTSVDESLWKQAQAEARAAEASSKRTFRNIRYALRIPEYTEEHQDTVYVRAFAGSYGPRGLPVYMHDQVFLPGCGPTGKGAMIPCNCGGGKRPEIPCVPHHLARKEKAEGKKSTYWSSPFYAINVAHLAMFHAEQLVGKKGTPYTKYSLCQATSEEEQNGCKGCAAKLPLVLANGTYIDLNQKHWNELMGFDSVVSKPCRNCNTQPAGIVAPVGATCPKCGTPVAGYTPSQLRKLAAEGGVCLNPKCRFTGPFVIVKGCRIPNKLTGSYKQGCDHPTTWSVWDININVAFRRNGTTQKELTVIEFDHDELDDEIATRCKPMDFSFLTYMEPAEQAEIMGVDNPFQGKTLKDFGIDTAKTAVSGDNEPDAPAEAPADAANDDYPF